MTQTTACPPAGLYIENPGQEAIAFPLQHAAVRARVAGNVARVEVRHIFENPFVTPLEATYIFPLPHEAAVDDMAIQIGERTIQGRIEKREAAQQLYDRAKRQGQTAGLLEQERPNIFTQSLANIRPGERIEVVISYSDRLAYKHGDYEFVFPMVVGPRYIPGHAIAAQGRSHGSAPAPMTANQDTDLVPDASRLNAPILPPNVRSGHDISVEVDIEMGDRIDPAKLGISSPSHQIQVAPQDDRLRVTLHRGDRIPNKDLILRYKVAGDRPQATVLTQADERGGHFSVYLVPAIQYDPDGFIPKDMTFLIDTSGSQAGAPLQKCQELMRRFVGALHPQDTFNIVDFANVTQQLSPVPLANTPANRQQALDYINRLHAGGGTRMLRGIQTVLNLPTVENRLRGIVLLTDGYIGNENQILAEVQRNLQPSARLHAFGAGSSVNRFLLDRIAELGRGISEVIRHDEDATVVADRFFQQINNPVLANLQLHWEGPGEAPQLYPIALPDLFAEQPLALSGRKADRQAGTLWLTGQLAGGGYYEQSLAVNFAAAGNEAIAQFWGRARIKDLMNRMVRGETKVGVDAVTQTALDYRLLSQYTAFVAISDDVRVENPQESIATTVPVNMPEGVEYEGVFGGRITSVSSIAAPGEMGAVRPISRKISQERSQERTTLSANTLMSRQSEESAWEIVEALQAEASQRQRPVSASAAQAASPAPKPIAWTLQIASADGLDTAAIAALQKHLGTIQLSPRSGGGDLTFELRIQNDRVRQVVLDERVSSLQDEELIAAIRRSLFRWHSNRGLTATVTLNLQVRSA